MLFIFYHYFIEMLNSMKKKVNDDDSLHSLEIKIKIEIVVIKCKLCLPIKFVYILLLLFFFHNLTLFETWQRIGKGMLAPCRLTFCFNPKMFMLRKKAVLCNNSKK